MFNSFFFPPLVENVLSFTLFSFTLFSFALLSLMHCFCSCVDNFVVADLLDLLGRRQLFDVEPAHLQGELAQRQVKPDAHPDLVVLGYPFFGLRGEALSSLIDVSDGDIFLIVDV